MTERSGVILSFGRFKILSLLLLLTPFVFTSIISCSSGSSHDLDARVKQLEDSQSRSIAQLQKVSAEMDSLNKGQLIAILDLLERSELHVMDEELQKATQINPRYLGTIRKLRRAVVGSSWPAPLREKAEEFKGALKELEMALTINDLTATRQSLRRSHLVYHQLTDAGWKMIAE